MKYLKRYNEELNASTYRSAGEIHKKEGSLRRAAVLLDYATQVELREKYEKLLQAQNQNKEFGLFDITVTRGYGSNKKDIFSGQFYLQMCLESDWFKDQRNDWLYEGMDWSMGIAMEFAIIPSDVETLKMIETSQDKDIEYFRNNSMWGDDYRYWCNRIWFTVCDKLANSPINTYNEKIAVKLRSELKSRTRGYLSTNEELKPETYISAADKLKKMDEFEDRDGFKFHFNSRSEAMKFKNLLANTLEGKANWGTWKDRTIADQLKEVIILDEEQWRKKLMDSFLPGRENEYDINNPDTWPKNPFTEDSYKRVVESVKKMSVNGLYRQDERPEQLKAWSETIKQREIEATHKKALEEAKKLGQFQLRFVGRGSEIRFANCYIQLYFNSGYYLTEGLPEWLDDDRDSLWSQFMFGVHPVSSEDLEVLNWFSGSDIKGYTNKANGIIWLQDIYINLTNQNYKDKDGVKLPLTPSGVISIEGTEFSEVYFANRREAIKFRNLLVSLFEGDIDYIQPNGKDFKDDILETWCEHDERPVDISELEDFIDKFRMVRLNSLYRD